MEIINNGGQSSFRVTCEYCECKFVYNLSDLGYRPWYPHGFVYCPQCNKPLRHKLEYRINPDGKTCMEGSSYTPMRDPSSTPHEKWVCSCGTENDGNFCTVCGKPREAAPKTGWFCVKCGTRNEGNFCANCGEPAPKINK